MRRLHLEDYDPEEVHLGLEPLLPQFFTLRNRFSSIGKSEGD